MKLKRLNKLQEESKKALLNVMEDLENANKLLQLEAVKDEAILDSIGDGVVGVDTEGIVMVINRAGSKLLGFKSRDLLGKKFVDVVEMIDEKGHVVPKYKRPINMAIAGNITTTTTTTTKFFYYLRKDGARFPVALTIRPIILGKIIGAIEVFRDVTNEVSIDRAKTEFVSIASHELRTPLSIIKWCFDMISIEGLGNLTRKQRKYLNDARKGNNRMITLVNTLLDVSRIDLGKFTIKTENTDIVKLIRDEIYAQKPKADKKKIKLSYVFKKTFPQLKMDPKLLQTVVQNILSNAIKYTPEKGKIKIHLSLRSAKNKAPDILIEVSDTGYGIPNSQQAKIFTKFFRADNTREKNPDGTGLGLYIIKSTIDRLGGSIWFTSRENKGSSFYISIPSVKI